MADQNHTTNWPELASGLYDKLTGKNAEITYEFEQMKMKVPSGTGPNAEHADWEVSGVMTIRTKDVGSSPN